MLLTFDRHERQRAARPNDAVGVAPYTDLANGLASDLEPLFTGALPIPVQKARLTRIGGRCPIHGTLLEFDPFAPHDHVCLQCHKPYRGREHDDWWAMGAQLWTIERAVHAGTLYIVRGEVRHANLAATILRTYADRYSTWPNTDNVLGPSRLFFSTYLESLWLLNVCHAVALLEICFDGWGAHDRTNIRDNVIKPALELIAGFPEGRSNRQVWNEVAILSALRLLGDDRQLRGRLRAPDGLCALIKHGLLPDGTWYEGENYHLFAHRGLWYGVELMRAMEEPLDATLNEKYSAGFVAPFLGVLPDDTFPSRRDSQYGSSIRQWRTAEWCELGWAHSEDPRLAGLLARMYQEPTGAAGAPEHGAAQTARARSTADAERNYPPTPLTRADLSWRALLMASTKTLPLETWNPGSVFLPAQGLAIIRRDHGRTYAALEGGQLGGGHGHPDQLALTLQTGAERWLQDPGTGSYVSPDLHWYRSTLAHNAPCIDNASQRPVAAAPIAYCDSGGFGWIVKRVEGIAEGVSVTRSIVVADGYLIDVVEWTSADDATHTLSLPIAGVADVLNDRAARWVRVEISPSDVDASPASPVGFMSEIMEMTIDATIALVVQPDFVRRANSANDAPAYARVWYDANVPVTLQKAIVPGAPGFDKTQQHRIVTIAPSGRIVGVWCWPAHGVVTPAIASVSLSPHSLEALCTITHVLEVHTHTIRSDGWHIECTPWVCEPTLFSNVAGSNLAKCEPAHPGTAVSENMPIPRAVHLPYLSPSEIAATTPSGNGDKDRSSTQLLDTHRWFPVPRIDQHEIPRQPGEAIPGAFKMQLGATHYVQTEPSWHDAGEPTADIQMAVTRDEFVVDIVARTGLPSVRAIAQENPLDNERSAVNCDGLQWYMASGPPSSPEKAQGHRSQRNHDWLSAGIHVPVILPSSATTGYSEPLVPNSVRPTSQWRLVPDGWAMRLTWPRSTLPLSPNGTLLWELVVNECVEGRERRRGQLVFSGGGGFGYLAGDRRPIDASVILQFDP